jgi:hypothetical protein
VLAQPLLLGPAAHDDQAQRDGGRGVDDARPKRCQSANDVLVPLLPDEPARRKNDVLARRDDRFAGCVKPVDIDARIADIDPLGRYSFEEERRASALGRGQEQIGLSKRLLAVGAGPVVSEGRKQRQRLPDCQD